MRADEVVDRRLVGGVDLRELQAHARCGDRSRRRVASASMSLAAPGSRNRTFTTVPVSSGLVVRIARPPWLMFSVSAAAMVLPTR